MNEKEMNLAILAELKRIAKEVFSNVAIDKAGTYTAAELWNEKDAFGEPIYVNYHGTENEIYTAEIGTFKMQVTPIKLWYVLWKFERLCNVKQADKMRFTYGNQEGENIAEKAMYLGKDNKVTTRKKNLIKLSERVAIEPNKKTKRYNMYYFATGMWYLVATNYDESMYEAINEQVEKDENFLFGLLQRWDLNTGNRLNPIYKALFDALKSERANSKPEQRKSENEAKNSVICEVVTGGTNYGALCLEHRRLKSIGNSLYKDDKNLYFLYDSFCYCLGGYTRGVATFLKEQGNNIQNKIREMIEQGGISTDSAKILYDKMRRNNAPEKSESVKEANENFPPEPYNKANTDDTGQKIEKCESSCDNQEKKCIVEHISDIQGKNMRPNYLQQKVFPSELFNSRRKISRFKPRYFVRYTNYHLPKENALERKRNANTSVYRVLIRGETKNNILTCRKTCFRL